MPIRRSARRDGQRGGRIARESELEEERSREVVFPLALRTEFVRATLQAASNPDSSGTVGSPDPSNEA
jgi:hypothetical protein